MTSELEIYMHPILEVGHPKCFAGRIQRSPLTNNNTTRPRAITGSSDSLDHNPNLVLCQALHWNILMDTPK